MRKRRTKARRPRLLAPILALLLLAALAAAAAVATAAEAGSDKIIRNVYVDDVRIGGMRTAEAAAALEKEFAARTVTLAADGEERVFMLGELGLRYKTDVLVGEAYDIGKRGGFLKNVAEICRSFVLPTRYSSADALVGSEPGEEAGAYFDSLGREPTPSSFEIREDKVVVTNGMNGRRVDVSGLVEALAASGGGSAPVEVPMEILPFEPPSPDDIYLKTASNPHAPYARASDGGITATVRSFNLDAAREIQKNNPDEGAVYEFAIDSEGVAPLDDDALYPDSLGSCTTEFDTSYMTRANNIKIAAGLLNGADLLPGETFSFNKHNGDITADKGYQVAHGYADGQIVDTVGAGVCQVSSTLYNAALLSNMEIVKRSCHSLPVAYLPLGQDAAISYPAQDFAFKNSSPSPVKIFASVGGGRLTVEIRGQNDGSFTEIKIENNTLSVTEPQTREVADETLAPGKRVVSQNGARGYVTESFRLVYKDGELTARQPLGRSTYKARDRIVRVGKEEQSEPSEQDSQLQREP